MRIGEFFKKARLVRNNETYRVSDLDAGHLILSITELHAGKSTTGHSHAEADEIYFCIGGTGRLQIGDEISPFSPGDFFHIPRGDFHRVFNDGDEGMIFMCVFEKYGERK